MPPTMWKNLVTLPRFGLIQCAHCREAVIGMALVVATKPWTESRCRPPSSVGRVEQHGFPVVGEGESPSLPLHAAVSWRDQ